MTLRISILSLALTLVACAGEAEEPNPMVTSSSSPSPSVVYDLPPDAQTMARVAFSQLTLSERANVCGFMTTYPKDAIRQGVDSGLTRKESRAIVEFVSGELC